MYVYSKWKASEYNEIEMVTLKISISMGRRRRRKKLNDMKTYKYTHTLARSLNKWMLKTNLYNKWNLYQKPFNFAFCSKHIWFDYCYSRLLFSSVFFYSSNFVVSVVFIVAAAAVAVVLYNFFLLFHSSCSAFKKYTHTHAHKPRNNNQHGKMTWSFSLYIFGCSAFSR